MGRSVSVIERITRGFGDGIMLRPAIIGYMKKYPTYDVKLHIREPEACVFEDIEGLDIVPISTFSKSKSVISDKDSITRAKRNRLKRYNYSKQLIEGYNNPIIYRVSESCAKYEMEHIDNVDKSRQEIFCDELNVQFDMANYNVKFSLEEEQFADDFLGGISRAIGIHIQTADSWRDYRYMYLRKRQTKMWDLVDYIAKRFNGYIITFDKDCKYEGRQKNVKSLANVTFRQAWVVMSRMLLGIGPDSAGIHAFGSTFVPTYGLFGPTNPRHRMLYPYVGWPDKGDCPFGKQYCWYNYCQNNGKPMVYCLNRRSVKYYWDDIKRKMGRFIK